ncbi:MAG: monovalent cation/H(+) antiporter subunit G [Clostridiales bacterium]|nr:monovalent cation/H(+) antiporter subunit G [Clostridiales bacterium]
MAMIEWLQFLVGAVLLLLGLGIFTVEMIGVFRFHYVLNRMHAAAMGDTLGIGFCLVGLIVMNGLNLTSLKLFFVVAFLWFSSPTSSHLIARLEVTTDTEKEKHYRGVSLRELEADSDGRKMADRKEENERELYVAESGTNRENGMTEKLAQSDGSLGELMPDNMGQEA